MAALLCPIEIRPDRLFSANDCSTCMVLHYILHYIIVGGILKFCVGLLGAIGKLTSIITSLESCPLHHFAQLHPPIILQCNTHLCLILNSETLTIRVYLNNQAVYFDYVNLITYVQAHG